MMVALNPRIRVREAVPADAEAITNTIHDGFSVDAMHQLMYPNGVSDDSRRKFAARLFSPTPPRPNEGEKLIMVAELLPEGSDGPGEIVAFSEWTLFRNPRAEEEWNAKEEPRTQEQLGEGCNVQVFNAFIGGLHKKRREHMKGDPGLVLGTLVCQTNRQRLGAGKALLHWGTTLADELSLPLFLESSPFGYNLYRQFGFEPIDVFDFPVFDLFGAVKREGQNWGELVALEFAGSLAKGCFRTAIMRRPAKSA
ncbi:hypothetical protein SMACR_01558 [Sordaria macrospora]|uniref:N-acetyltransferase domain-containing protein n=1 Tax=Sordaria macrospora TaxID=5147 RepID=A0A8S9A1J8_SORMA|nr:hypothetical protein SMACR_01558 [Sordaria macrospora]WPJ58554.1 hypothetical protein SMAC4_01558 [Sordaria macrospora]